MKATIWSKDMCPYCEQAKALLTAKGIEYDEKKIAPGSYTKEQLLESVPTARTVPQIFLGDLYIGGFDKLKEYFSKERV